jgi:integrase
MEGSKIVRLKTTNAHRIVDIHPDVAVRLARLIQGKDGLVFATTTGWAHNSSNILRRWPHPVLKQLGIPKTGFHAFRRFRATHLRKQRVQESLIKAWLGHSGGTLTDLYDRSATDSSYRKMAVEQAGIGFELPAIVPCVLKSSEREVSVAA